MGLPEAVIARYVDNRQPSPVLPMDEKIIEAQQATADLFYANKLLPKRLDVKNALAASTPIFARAALIRQRDAQKP